jgi:hypothetical protein
MNIVVELLLHRHRAVVCFDECTLLDFAFVLVLIPQCTHERISIWVNGENSLLNGNEGTFLSSFPP